jgi:predicted RNA binding protein YcfA (HicA-like mRNA interferase family)
MRPKPSKAKEVVRVAKKNGFAFDHQTGSHAVYYRSFDGKRVVIAMYSGDLKTDLLRQLIRDMGMSVEEFNEQV